MENIKNLQLKYLTKGVFNLYFFYAPLLDEPFMSIDLSNILSQIKLNNLERATTGISELKPKIPIDNLLKNLSLIFSFLSEEGMTDVPDISKATGLFYIDATYGEKTLTVIDSAPKSIIFKFIELAEESNNLYGACYELFIAMLRIFKSLGNKEPFPIKKIREDLEYVFLIQMYLNGSKELPEKRTDNFNYALLSEFLKKDDLRVLKSIEDYLDSAETKTLSAAGSVAQSIEKEDLEPGVKKVKKDIERIEKLED